MPRVGRPSTPLVTARALAAHWSIDGGYDGTPASEATAPARSSRPEPDSRQPRLAASIAPGPPPVATAYLWPSIQPSRAASAYCGEERSRAWPPITPTRCRPEIQEARASSIAWSCSDWASVARGVAGSRDQAYARASSESAYGVTSYSSPGV